jgi:hypothetical protein
MPGTTVPHALPDGDGWESPLKRIHPTAVREAVIREVASWVGVRVREHRYGGIEFRVGRRELGHLHAFIADLPFPRRIRDELVASGSATPHHVLPDSGWITIPMRTVADVKGVIELFQWNYQRARAADAPPAGRLSAEVGHESPRRA